MFNIYSYVHRNEEVNLFPDADDEIVQQVTQLPAGKPKIIARPYTSASYDIPPTDTLGSDGNNAFSNDNILRHISSKEDIMKELALLYVRKKLSLSAVGAIAKLIVALGHDIPIDPRTILQTTNTPIRNKSFHHFSLKNGLLQKLKKGMIGSGNLTIKCQINIDGTPVFKTNSVDLWPILCRVVNSLDSSPFVISIFAGKGKPPSLEEYLRPFLTEMIQLQSEGVEFESKCYSVEIISFVCDAPARQFLKVITGHGGYGGCERCSQTGVFDPVYHCMTFPELVDISLRTDDTFRYQIHKNHHKGNSPLLDLNINMISSFPLDYMHLVLLGVFKRLLTIWTGDWSKKHYQHRLGTWDKTQLEKRLRRIRHSYPEEFHRITITLKYPKQLKANELRTILLYTGPVLFKGILSSEKYIHFLYLHLAIRILCSPTLSKTYSHLARSSLQYFAFQFGEIYGKNHLIYNVHSLIHIVDDCEIHGTLDSSSAFPFETFLGQMKMLVRSPNKVLAQIVKRISELEHVSQLESASKKSIFDHERPVDMLRTLKHHVKPSTKKDSFYLCENGMVIKVTGFSNTQISFKPFILRGDFFSKPVKSTNLYISKSSGMEEKIETALIDDLQLHSKCWVIPTAKGCCIVPILHHSI